MSGFEPNKINVDSTDSGVSQLYLWPCTKLALLQCAGITASQHCCACFLVSTNSHQCVSTLSCSLLLLLLLQVRVASSSLAAANGVAPPDFVYEDNTSMGVAGALCYLFHVNFYAFLTVTAENRINVLRMITSHYITVRPPVTVEYLCRGHVHDAGPQPRRQMDNHMLQYCFNTASNCPLLLHHCAVAMMLDHSPASRWMITFYITCYNTVKNCHALLHHCAVAMSMMLDHSPEGRWRITCYKFVSTLLITARCCYIRCRQAAQ
jgi:hypothetical protein